MWRWSPPGAEWAEDATPTSIKEQTAARGWGQKHIFFCLIRPELMLEISAPAPHPADSTSITATRLLWQQMTGRWFLIWTWGEQTPDVFLTWGILFINWVNRWGWVGRGAPSGHTSAWQETQLEMNWWSWTFKQLLCFCLFHLYCEQTVDLSLLYVFLKKSRVFVVLGAVPPATSGGAHVIGVFKRVLLCFSVWAV